MIADSHNDFIMENQITDSNITNYLTILKNSNVKLLNFAFFTSQTPDFDLKKAIKTKNNILNISKNIFPNFTPIFSIEDMGFFDCKNSSYTNLLKLSPFCCSLTWNPLNKFGGGAFSNGKLTSQGIQLLKFFHQHKILLDTAHLNEQTFWDCMKFSDKNILCTHTCLKFIYNHPRNLSDAQVRYIIESNGYIGIAFVKDFHINNNDIFNANTLAKNICKIVDKYGIENFGIGSDFFGTKSLPIDIINYCDFKILENELKNNGMTNNEIKRIFYENFVKFVNNNSK